MAVLNKLRNTFLFMVGLCILTPSFAAEADAIYYNGKFVTLSKSAPIAEAVAILNGRFVAVGSNSEVMQHAGPSTQRIDLKGKTVLPGLNDSHTHPIMAALSEQEEPIPVLKSIADIKAHIKKRVQALAPDRIIFVPKVYSTRLTDQRYPTRYELDEASGDRVALTDNGYAAVLNSAALRRAEISKSTPEPKNGKIIRDKNGEPTGLILGAPQLLSSLRQNRETTHADLLWAIREMHKSYNAVGITTTIDRGQTAEGFRAYLDLWQNGGLTVRSFVTYRISAQGTPADVRQEIERIPFVTGWGDEWFKVGSLKTVADGGILIGTAYLREAYGNNTDIYGYKDDKYQGVLAVTRENLTEMAKTANRLGWQMTAHTTGGGATDALLDAYEAADKEKSIVGRRFTVTHGNFPNARAIERAKKMGVAFDVQPAWHHYDGPALRHVFGPQRTKDFLPLRSMIDAGIVVAGGSDHMIKFDSRAAINPYNPFFGMWMAITRKMSNGEALYLEQAVTRDEALRMWTINGAYLSFEESLKGTIEPGKLADLVVISHDYTTCPVDQIKDIEAVQTIIGGRVVYQQQ